MENKDLLKTIKRKIIFLYPFAFTFTLIFLLLPAGTWKYWNAWVYSLLVFISGFLISLYFLKNNPEFLERRMKFKEKEIRQKILINLSALITFAAFLLCGLDYRYKWSFVPLWLVTMASLILILGFLIVFLAFKENHFAGRTIEIFDGHEVIDTGLYAIVRHPMYVGMILVFISTPLVLGSYFAAIPFIIMSFGISLRIINEEKTLTNELSGYKEYCGKVKYRLIPYLW